MIKIYLNNMQMHAYHGLLPQERTVGNDYTVNLAVDYPAEKACLSDDVAHTMNYAEAASLVIAEMQKPGNLLESVAYRIAQAIFARFPLAESVSIDIQKHAPPISVDIDGAGITLTLSR